MLPLTAGTLALAAGASAAAVMARSGPSVAHVVAAPARLGSFTEQPKLATQVGAAKLRQQIVAESAGEAKNAIDAVYEHNAGHAGSSGQQVILFIGGNLAGSSADAFINSFTGKLPGAVTTSAGSLGGAAACVPGAQGRPAACAWADSDTFGVLASANLSASALAADMRQMRPMIEHKAK